MKGGVTNILGLIIVDLYFRSVFNNTCTIPCNLSWATPEIPSQTQLLTTFHLVLMVARHLPIDIHATNLHNYIWDIHVGNPKPIPEHCEALWRVLNHPGALWSAGCHVELGFTMCDIRHRLHMCPLHTCACVKCHLWKISRMSNVWQPFSWHAGQLQFLRRPFLLPSNCSTRWSSLHLLHQAAISKSTHHLHSGNLWL